MSEIFVIRGQTSLYSLNWGPTFVAKVALIRRAIRKAKNAGTVVARTNP
jgi:hypothetical protein